MLLRTTIIVEVHPYFFIFARIKWIIVGYRDVKSLGATQKTAHWRNRYGRRRSVQDGVVRYALRRAARRYEGKLLIVIGARSVAVTFAVQAKRCARRKLRAVSIGLGYQVAALCWKRCA